MLRQFFQLLLSLSCLLVNAVILFGLYWKKELHQITFYPVLIQSICDLAAVGIFGIFEWIEQFFKLKVAFIAGSATIFDLWNRWSEATSKAGLDCFLSVASELINDFGTGPCMLVIAIDRYLNVFHPHGVNIGRIKKFRIGLNVTMTCIVTGFIGAFAVNTFIGMLVFSFISSNLILCYRVIVF